MSEPDPARHCNRPECVRKSSGLADRVNRNTPSAADEVFHRYYPQLCRLVARMMGKRIRRRFAPEDIVQSALATFFDHVGRRKIQVADSVALECVIKTYTRKKALQSISHQLKKRRRPHAEESVDVRNRASCEPGHEEAVLMKDALAEALRKLAQRSKPKDTEILWRKLRGDRAADIAADLDCSVSTVNRTLQWIMTDLERYLTEGIAS